MKRRSLLKLAVNTSLTLIAPNFSAVASTQSWGQMRTPAIGLSSPVGIAIASSGDIFIASYAADYGGTEVKRVYKDGATHVVAGGFRSPVGLAVNYEQNRAIVVDWGSNSAYEMKISV